MKSTYKVYVDESGDEGFVFREDGSGSSRWFVLSAVVVRRKYDLELVSCLKNVRQLLRKPPKFSFHFVKLRHEQRVPYVRRVGVLPIRTVTVMVYKPLIREPEKFQAEKYLLYRYTTRLLLERVSWLCRDSYVKGDGDGTAEVIFSNRSNMSYNDLRSYIDLLLSRSGIDGVKPVQIDSAVIVADKLRAVEHSRLAGLQIADAVASGLHFAVKKNVYGEAEPAYLAHLAKTIYRRRAIMFGYGLKLWPEDAETTKKHAPEVANLEGASKS